MLKDVLTGAGIYPMPIGTAGICAVDVRDIAEAAAISLTKPIPRRGGKAKNVSMLVPIDVAQRDYWKVPGVSQGTRTTIAHNLCPI